MGLTGVEVGSKGSTSTSLNDILINTRGAADLVGATKMDRPEWIDTFPESLTAIATLTNNSARGTTGTNPRTGLPNSPTDETNPRAANTYGHIIRWFYLNDFTEPTFGWDIFALCGDPANPAHGATIVGDKFGSPDAVYVAPSGRLWIQTDVSGSTINAGASTRSNLPFVRVIGRGGATAMSELVGFVPLGARPLPPRC